ncbi:baseplate assembly protein [Acinetobacter pseudolwoffii]|uniref:Baseplate J family protein n=1 Tax=Acinetobacter pseudolwoffii TaxID=2053287 RepID=A0A2H9UMW0_9GAMM|nr:baseplate J/gp47 family protein [Acinetobacter pseudolwoffii]PJI33035.1 baseplate J family protein [Acinetobacter pseudolwoffii]
MSNTSSSAIDLSLLAPPDVVKQISFEEILKLRLEQFYQEMRQDQPDFPDLLESDPAMKLAQVFAYGEMLIRQDANEQALAVLLAFAKDNDLDHKASERNLQRRIISPATDTTPEVKESNESLRRRVQLAPEGQTTAGSEGSYIFHGLNADPRVKDIYPYAPLDENGYPNGICNIYVLSNEGTGEASEDLLNIVTAALNAKSVRPLTDRPIIYSASILNYSIQAEIFIDEGPDENIVLNSCYKAAEEYTKKTHSFNDGVSLSGIYQALHQPGVSRVNLILPAGNVDTSFGQVAYCTGINISRASL